RSVAAGRAAAAAPFPRRRARALRGARLLTLAPVADPRRWVCDRLRGAGGRVSRRPKIARVRRVLIANRGEIAVRVIRTLRERGITSVAVFSEPDREALHVLLADEAYPIGPGPARGGVDEAGKAARAIGFPVMLKAAAGGGGKGMRIVSTEAELAAAWELARGEASAAFDDDRIYVERFIERPRHVEAQILADAKG